ncbi:MAG TPA: zinc-ribbon domain-containing protein [Pyrinomonadaceae bacterium]|nr:zinc-ribbon domain-containing protein [Pyrinomonadaceae bacterium]
MALIYCPECGHEISNAAVACPSCGRPISAKPVIERRIVPEAHDEGVPKYVIIPLVVIACLVLAGLLVLFYRTSADPDANLKVGVNTQRPDSAPISVPSGPTTTAPVVNDSQVSAVPGSQVGVEIPPTKGSVTIDAKIADRNGPQPVKKEKFYLLDRDLETILNDADLEPIAGQTLLNSLGLSVAYPDRYGSFNSRALAAIKPHIKYAGITDANGKATLGGIEPNSYYLFGVARSGSGFAIWSAPVSVIAGDNTLNLAPVTLTEINVSSGE